MAEGERYGLVYVARVEWEEYFREALTLLRVGAPRAPPVARWAQGVERVGSAHETARRAHTRDARDEHGNVHRAGAGVSERDGEREAERGLLPPGKFSSWK